MKLETVLLSNRPPADQRRRPEPAQRPGSPCCWLRPHRTATGTIGTSFTAGAAPYPPAVREGAGGLGRGDR